MRCVVLEILRGGLKSTPPAGSRLAQTPAGARVNVIDTASVDTRHYLSALSDLHLTRA